MAIIAVEKDARPPIARAIVLAAQLQALHMIMDRSRDLAELAERPEAILWLEEYRPVRLLNQRLH